MKKALRLIIVSIIGAVISVFLAPTNQIAWVTGPAGFFVVYLVGWYCFFRRRPLDPKEIILGSGKHPGKQPTHQK